MIKKKNFIIMIGIVALILIVLSVAFWYYYARLEKFFLIPKSNDIITTEVTECNLISDMAEKKSCEEQGYAAWQAVIKFQASNKKDAKFCEIIPSGVERDICFLELVNVVPDPQVCARISDSILKGDCSNNLLAQSNDFTACKTIQDAGDRHYCFEKIIISYDGGGEKLCPSLSGEDMNICWEIYYIREAVSRVDYGLCQKVPTVAGIKNCLERLPPDSDGDTLSDYMEIAIYKTNPLKADTDGDGYSDGEEVKTGHNPLGK